MATQTIKMPDIGEGIAEVELVAWHVKVGDVVAEDQILADVMTDKATVEIPSSVGGTVMSVGTEIIQIEVQGVGQVTSDAAPAMAQAAAGTARVAGVETGAGATAAA